MFIHAYLLKAKDWLFFRQLIRLHSLDLFIALQVYGKNAWGSMKQSVSGFVFSKSDKVLYEKYTRCRLKFEILQPIIYVLLCNFVLFCQYRTNVFSEIGTLGLFGAGLNLAPLPLWESPSNPLYNLRRNYTQ